MTNLIDIYEAAGAQVNEDRTQVSMIPGQMQPFDIVLRVFPTSVEMIDSKSVKITFAIDLHSDVLFEKKGRDHVVHYVDYNEEITLPVSQVKILKKD